MKSNKARWLVQKNMVGEDDLAKMVTSFETNDIDYELITVIPFSTEIPKIKKNTSGGPDVFFGTCNIAKLFRNDRKFTRSVFGDKSAFKMSTYIKEWGTDCLNSDAKFCKLKDIKLKDGESVFVRPDEDDKMFIGTILDTSDLHDWVKTLQFADLQELLDTKVCVASSKKIMYEWRLFIVNHKVVTGSLYRISGRLTLDDFVPKPVIDFAESIARKWSPHNIFVLDVCTVETTIGGTEFKVIEAGCFNSAGFYASDIDVIVREVSRAAEILHPINKLIDNDQIRPCLT